MKQTVIIMYTYNFYYSRIANRAEWFNPPRNGTIAVKKEGRDIEGRTARFRFKFWYIGL